MSKAKEELERVEAEEKARQAEEKANNGTTVTLSDDTIKKTIQKTIPTLNFWAIKEDMTHKNWLVGNGFIKRGACALINAPSGSGKSSLGFQMAMAFSYGKDCLGFSLYHKEEQLKILIVQKEDDADRLAHDRDSIINHHKEDYPQYDPENENATSKIEMINEIAIDETTNRMFTMGTCDTFIKNMEKALEENRPDVCFINPLYLYIGNSMDNENASAFWNGGVTTQGIDFGIGLVGLAKQYNCAIVCFTHPNKPNDKSTKSQLQTALYSISGSSNITNSARSILVFYPVEGHEGKFIFYGAKNGNTLGWRDINGNPTKYAVYEHDPDPNECYWHMTDPAEATAILDKLELNVKPQHANKNTEKKISKLNNYQIVDNLIRKQLAIQTSLTREEVEALAKIGGINSDTAIKNYCAHLTECNWIKIDYEQHKKPIYSLKSNC